ncbi:MAG: hypothetical protein FWH27_05530, partial [Planctomycetaceae bacterium]|nr:hypothetical protein [Planctomycetaceae bacterium]
MGSIRKNYSKSFPHVQDRFAGEVGKLFDKKHPGRECPNSVFIRVLFCALCHIQSLFAVCRNLQKCPDDRTVAAAILKTLPEYDAFQKKINEVLAEGLPSNLSRGRQRLAIDLVLIPYHGKPYRHENEIYRSQPKS